MKHWPFETIASVQQAIVNKQVSPVEVTQMLLARIRRWDSKLSSFITVMEEAAMQEAVEREKDVMSGTTKGPLHGVPIAVKDIIQTRGVRTTAGSKLFAEWVPDEDATVISKLREAGAIVIGKTNLHEFAMGATTENPFYGSARNPWNLAKIPGGSSGGSAVALAAGFCYGALGTDTAGSIRLPSALCGTVGMKPTYGRVSRHGCLPFSWSLDHIGPMTRTVNDAAILLKVIEGKDRRDDSSVAGARPIDPHARIDSLKGCRIGVCREYFFEGVDSEIEQLVNQALNQLQALGAEVVELVLPGIADALWAQKAIAQAEGYTFHQPMLDKRADLYSDDVKFRLQFGKNVSAADYLNAQRIRKAFIRQTLGQMAAGQVDLLVSPMNHNPPFDIGSVTPEEAINNMFRLAKAPLVSMLGFPALALPCGFTQDRLPVGMQLIGKPFDEQQLFCVGELYEQSQGWVAALAQNTAYH